MRYTGVAGVFFFQAEDGIRDLVRSRGLGDVYKRQDITAEATGMFPAVIPSSARAINKKIALGANAIIKLSLIHI